VADVNLSKAVRSNLLSLQSTAASMAKTQERLATGLKVNSALDNPTNFFTAASLNSRAGDMSNLLDSMSNGIKTIEAADNGLSSITKTVESMQSTLRQRDRTSRSRPSLSPWTPPELGSSNSPAQPLAAQPSACRWAVLAQCSRPSPQAPLSPRPATARCHSPLVLIPRLSQPPTHSRFS
jgi:hypothetical protein